MRIVLFLGFILSFLMSIVLFYLRGEWKEKYESLQENLTQEYQDLQTLKRDVQLKKKKLKEEFVTKKQGREAWQKQFFKFVHDYEKETKPFQVLNMKRESMVESETYTSFSIQVLFKGDWKSSLAFIKELENQKFPLYMTYCEIQSLYDDKDLLRGHLELNFLVMLT